MDREEILSKVHKDNEPDEMEMSIIVNALGISSIVVPIMCLLFLIVRILRGDRDVSDLLAITFMQLFSSEIYHYLKEKNKLRLIKSIIFLIIGLINILNFIFL